MKRMYPKTNMTSMRKGNYKIIPIQSMVLNIVWFLAPIIRAP